MTNTTCFDSPARNALPAYLFDTYLRYKQGTRAIVAWLMSQSTTQLPDPNKVSIGDLWDMSKIVQARSKPLPDTIDFHFRETINARKRLTQYFRDKSGASLSDRSTTDHAFFTNSLSEIYTILCNHKAHCSHDLAGPKHTALGCSSNHSRNVYDVLEVAHSELPSPDPHHTEHCDVCHETEAVTTGKSRATPELVDDQLGETLELMKIFQDIRDVCDAVNRSWEQVAREEIPLVLAAFIANVAFQSLKGYQSQVQLQWDIKDPAALHDRVQEMKLQPKCGQKSTPGSSVLELGIAEEHREVWDTVLRLKEIAPAGSTRVKVTDYQVPAKYINQDGRRNAEGISVLLCCIADLSASGTSNSIVQLHTPVFSDAAGCLGGDSGTEDCCPLRCTTGLLMMYEGYRSYLWPTGKTTMTKASPRIQALRFAKETRESIKAVLDNPTMPCRCCYTLAANLEGFQLDLDAFLKEKRFNLFFQAPWSSGSHILEILETSFSYGMRLCSYRHYLGSVLHLYNLLTALGHMAPVPFLEALCNVLGDTVFPGGRPKNKFSACFLRSKGGRLKQARNQRKDWHLAIPKNSAREAAGFGLPGEPVDSRFQAKKLSLLHYFKSRDYNLDDNILEKTQKTRSGAKSGLNDPEPRDGTSKQAGSRRDSGCHVDEQVQDKFQELQNMIANSELVASPTNPLPIGRINFFKVYLAAVQTVSKISDAQHEEQPAGRYCLCFVDELLRRGDEVTSEKGAGRLSPFGYKGLVNLCEDSIVRAFDVQEGDWSQYMWTDL